MTSSQLPLVLLMLFAGTCIPLMAAMNAKLGGALSSPSYAVLVLCLVASVTALILVTFTSPMKLSSITWPTNPLLYGAGVLFIVYIFSITYSAPKIGLGNAIFLVLLGQMVAAAVIDHQGWFAATATPLTLKRTLGIMLMIAGGYCVMARPEG